jgi:hypothetical protein
MASDYPVASQQEGPVLFASPAVRQRFQALFLTEPLFGSCGQAIVFFGGTKHRSLRKRQDPSPSAILRIWAARFRQCSASSMDKPAPLLRSLPIFCVLGDLVVVCGYKRLFEALCPTLRPVSPA